MRIPMRFVLFATVGGSPRRIMTGRLSVLPPPAMLLMQLTRSPETEKYAKPPEGKTAHYFSSSFGESRGCCSPSRVVYIPGIQWGSGQGRRPLFPKVPGLRFRGPRLRKSVDARGAFLRAVSVSDGIQFHVRLRAADSPGVSEAVSSFQDISPGKVSRLRERRFRIMRFPVSDIGVRLLHAQAGDFHQSVGDMQCIRKIRDAHRYPGKHLSASSKVPCPAQGKAPGPFRGNTSRTFCGTPV